ncbi:hypothetical protein O6P43_029438 [Quillaja saponaria]|uniref:Uncharacterized protein n=1 Tax=Quillaja saponaria TaxID=32244 RepID=A0AAD7PB31_QUISA|nr:hypothetical protein O6P43_029438 [Quillaja saponaria]
MALGRGGGRRGSSCGSSGSKDSAYAAASANILYNNSLKESPRMCQVMYDFYLECVKTKGTDRCKHYDEQLALCPDAVSGKLPRVHAVEQMEKMAEEEEKKAASKGFANYQDYVLDNMRKSNNPIYCRNFFDQYKECQSRGNDDCEKYFKRYPWCPQFKKLSQAV